MANQPATQQGIPDAVRNDDHRHAHHIEREHAACVGPDAAGSGRDALEADPSRDAILLANQLD